MRRSIQRLSEIYDSITRLIETYDRKMEIISEDAAEEMFCNSYRKGQLAAYIEMIHDLREVIEDERRAI